MGDKQARDMLNSCNFECSAALLLDEHAEERFDKRNKTEFGIYYFIRSIGAMKRGYVYNPKKPDEEQIFFSDEDELLIIPSYFIKRDSDWLTEKIYRALRGPGAVFLLPTVCLPDPKYRSVYFKEDIEFVPELIRLEDNPNLKGLIEKFKLRLRIED